MLNIRKAAERDLSAMLAIYNYEVENGTATLDLEAVSLEARREWFGLHNKNNHPLIVAEINGVVAGYACLSPFRVKPAYNSTVELSVYVSHEHRGGGVGKALMDEILKMARNDEKTHLVVSVITSENTVSCLMHEALGFSLCGRIHEAAFKFGRALDVIFYELKV